MSDHASGLAPFNEWLAWTKELAAGKNAEEIIRRTVTNPTADREVWLLLGNLLERAELERELKRNKPSGYAVRAAYLLQSTISNVAAVGARMTVFCH